MSENKLIQISDRDWHYRLVKFCWGIDPMIFKNLCPYFWLTVASIFVCPFVALFKTLKYICIKFVSGFVYIMDRISNYLSSFNYEKTINNLTNGQIYYIINHDKSNLVFDGNNLEFFYGIKRKYGKSFDEMIDDIIKVKKLNKDIISDSFKDDYKRDVAKEKKKAYALSEKLKELNKIAEEKRRKRVQKYQEDEEKKRIQRQKMEKFAKNVSKVTKSIFNAIYIAILCGLFFALSQLLTYLLVPTFNFFGEVNWIDVLKEAGIIIGVIIVGVCLSLFIYYSVYKLATAIENINGYSGYKYKILVGTKKTIYWLCDAVIFIIKYLMYYPFYIFIFKMIIVGIFNGFVEGFNEFGGIFADYFNASYSDYCPGIEWEKKSEVK